MGSTVQGIYLSPFSQYDNQVGKLLENFDNLGFGGKDLCNDKESG